MHEAPITPLPTELYLGSGVKQLDQIAIHEHHMSDLMERAGRAVFQVLTKRWPDHGKLLVFAGAGNNAGDGFVVARLAEEAGYAVQLMTLSDPKKLKGDALVAFQKLQGSHVHILQQQDAKIGEDTIVVDALLGTGLTKEVTGDWANAIETINASGAPTLAIDIPSGLCADTGSVRGVAVQADICVTLIGLKVGLFTGFGPNHYGELFFNNLGVPSNIYSQVTPCAFRLGKNNVFSLSARKRTAHKVDHGHILLIGGNQGMSGAIHLAGEAALRCGAGLVSVATHPEHAAWLNSNRPELMCHSVTTAADLEPMLEKATCIAIGPGLGQDQWARNLLQAVIDDKRPMILDADALNLLAQEPSLAAAMREHPNRILTPHPGEAGRLLAMTTTGVQGNRLSAIRSLTDTYGSVAVLKGAGSLVSSADEETLFLSDKGNPGMATAGTGDVLTGVLAALIAQGIEPLEAAKLGVYLHALAGDEAAKEGERGLVAGDLLPVLRKLVNS